MSYIEEHISYHIGTMALRFVRRPVAGALPKDGWFGFVELMKDGRREKACVGRWRNGVWDNGKGRDLAFEPTHWTELVNT